MTPKWMSQARCRGMDPSRFFPYRGESPSIGVCWICPVRVDCLNHALEHGEWAGIWGGMSAGARRRMALRRVS